MKSKMMQGMKKSMLSCDDATFYISKRLETNIGFVKRMQLFMHLMFCKYCRRFEKEIAFISKMAKDFRKKDQNIVLNEKLTDSKKDDLQKLISEKIS